ncbi:MAG: hypothetical protein LBM16_00210 [Clostridiales bacterium]|jgi:hypothetical protein|nr:hypothetical protein [Clostridiales bacterium]
MRKILSVEVGFCNLCIHRNQCSGQCIYEKCIPKEFISVTELEDDKEDVNLEERSSEDYTEDVSSEDYTESSENVSPEDYTEDYTEETANTEEIIERKFVIYNQFGSYSITGNYEEFRKLCNVIIERQNKEYGTSELEAKFYKDGDLNRDVSLDDLYDYMIHCECNECPFIIAEIKC